MREQAPWETAAQQNGPALLLLSQMHVRHHGVDGCAAEWASGQGPALLLLSEMHVKHHRALLREGSLWQSINVPHT